jgi:hypothetical protein
MHEAPLSERMIGDMSGARVGEGCTLARLRDGTVAQLAAELEGR